MHRAAFLTFPFPGDKERLEIRSHSLAAAGGHHKGPPWAERGARWRWGGLRGQQSRGRDAVSCCKDWESSIPAAPFSPASSISTILPPHCSSRAEGCKGEFGGEGKDPILSPQSKFRLPLAPWLS